MDRYYTEANAAKSDIPWDQCPECAWTNGPLVEGETLGSEWDRFSYRWQAVITNGVIEYGRSGTAITTSNLWPTPQTGASKISFAFDINAKPVFALQQTANLIEVRKYVAGTPTAYTFTGRSPCLFYDGDMQRDINLRDVVCYYINNGKLCVRFQRDNFGTEYVLADPVSPDGTGSVTRIGTVIRGHGGYANRTWLAAYTGIADKTPQLFRSGLYEPWPAYVFEQGEASITFDEDGHYQPGVITVEHTDTASAGLLFDSDGDYWPTVINQVVSDSASASVTIDSDGNYMLAVVSIPATTETSSASATIDSDGDYYQSVVSGGSYTETSSATVTFDSDGSYTI
jgi:hypothetical protein